MAPVLFLSFSLNSLHDLQPLFPALPLPHSIHSLVTVVVITPDIPPSFFSLIVILIRVSLGNGSVNRPGGVYNIAPLFLSLFTQMGGPEGAVA